MAEYIQSRAKRTSKPKTDDGKAPAEVTKRIKSSVDVCVSKRRDLIDDWQNSIDRRRGKESDTDSDQNRQRTAEDWSMTNAKVAQTFSQLPRVIVTGRGPYKDAASVFEDRLNFRLEKASVGTTMNEIMVDTVNAAGIGIVNVEYEATTEEKELEEINPEVGFMRATAMQLGLEPIPKQMKTIVVDRRFSVNRVSADNFIWPTDFQRSNFDFSPFLGYDGEMPWSRAKNVFNLADEDKASVTGRVKGEQDKMVPDTQNTEKNDDSETVPFTEIFYWRYLYHPDEKYFAAIQRLVFIKGKEEPVINERWKGQQFDPSVPGGYIGACRFPIRVFTLHYISNEAIPPSDSAIARPLVAGLEKTFQQMEEQREHAKPLSWINVNRIDADILAAFMRGDWNGVLPVQGRGDEVIGQVQKPNYPNDDFAINNHYQNALMRAWSIGPNQMGAPAATGKSATESGIVQTNHQIRSTQERAMAVAFFLGIADVMAGLMCLYDDFQLPAITPEKAQMLTMWDRKKINHELAFSIRGDSSIIMSAEQRWNYLERWVNMVGKSAYADPTNALKEMTAIAGLDPADVKGPPQKGPEKPKISWSFKGEDLANPIALALLGMTDYMPSPEQLEAGRTLAKANGLVGPLVKSDAVDATPGDGDQLPTPETEDLAMKDDRPDWQMPDRINSRRDAAQNQGNGVI